eukprot:s7248_g2.t2
MTRCIETCDGGGYVDTQTGEALGPTDEAAYEAYLQRLCERHRMGEQPDRLTRIVDKYLPNVAAENRAYIMRFPHKAAPFDLVAFFRRLLAAPSQRQGRTSASEAVTPYEALRRGFGLPQCFERGLCTEEDFQAQLARCLRGGRLRWNRLFGGAKRPTLLEVCSGTGDWVVAQAQADAGRANWVASELRYDRAWSIMTKAIFAGADNLAVIAGDAGTVLKEWVLPGSVAKVCVNFPEPPQTTRNANCDEAESELHLLTSDFFEDVHKALGDGGVLTIFSDNQEYMRSLARTLGLLRRSPGGRLFEASGDVDASHLEDAEEMCGLLICRGCPSEAEGHAAKVSSQFDRFFQHGQHTDRFYISVVKVQVTSQDDQQL